MRTRTLAAEAPSTRLGRTLVLRDQSPAIGDERVRVQSSRSGDLVTRTSQFAQYSVRPTFESRLCGGFLFQMAFRALCEPPRLLSQDGNMAQYGNASAPDAHSA